MSDPTGNDPTGNCWRVTVTFDNGDQRWYWHLDEHYSVKQYAAVLQAMNEGAHHFCRVTITDDRGAMHRDSDTDHMNRSLA